MLQVSSWFIISLSTWVWGEGFVLFFKANLLLGHLWFIAWEAPGCSGLLLYSIPCSPLEVQPPSVSIQSIPLTHFPLSFPSFPSGTATLCSVSVFVWFYLFICFIFYISHLSENHTVFIFPFHGTLKIHPCCHKWQAFILSMTEYVSQCIYLHHSFFIHSSTDGLLGCFHVLALINNPVTNMGVHISFWVNVLFLWLYSQEWNCWIM